MALQQIHEYSHMDIGHSTTQINHAQSFHTHSKSFSHSQFSRKKKFCLEHLW